MTIRQLRELQVYLQRLCKTMLLRRNDGTPIQWFDLDMYDIAHFVIKPSIAHVEQERGTHRRDSWAEFVSAEEQVPDIMSSHSWAGRFRDFVSIVSKFANTDGLSSTFKVWICTFANSQFGEDFGVCLRSSPFYKAISIADGGTLLVVDRELHLTMTMGKALRVYTSSGEGGVSVTSGRLVSALEGSDRRQILNFLGRGEAHERDGLAKDVDGNLLLEDGWRKSLESSETAPHAMLRKDGREEFAHGSE